MSKAEERSLYAKNREQNIRFIRSKIVCASARDAELIAAFIQGLGIEGMSFDEYNRNVETKEVTK